MHPPLCLLRIEKGRYLLNSKKGARGRIILSWNFLEFNNFGRNVLQGGRSISKMEYKFLHEGQFQKNLKKRTRMSLKSGMKEPKETHYAIQIK